MNIQLLNLPPIPTTSTPDLMACAKCGTDTRLGGKLQADATMICTQCASLDYLKTWRTLQHTKGVMLALSYLIGSSIVPDYGANADAVTIQGTTLIFTTSFNRTDVLEIANTALIEATHDLGELPLPIVPFIRWNYNAGELCHLEFHNLAQYANCKRWENYFKNRIENR